MAIFFNPQELQDEDVFATLKRFKKKCQMCDEPMNETINGREQVVDENGGIIEICKPCKNKELSRNMMEDLMPVRGT